MFRRIRTVGYLGQGRGRVPAASAAGMLLGLAGVAILFAFVFNPRAASADGEQILFEIHGPFTDMPIWGRHSDSAIDIIVQKFVAQREETLCTVQHRIAKCSSFTGSANLAVIAGGANPTLGVIVATSSVPASVIPGNTFSYTAFPLSACVVLQPLQTYWFQFTNSGPVGTGFISAVRASNEYGHTSYWQFQPYTFSPVGWVEYPGRELAIRLDGPVNVKPSITDLAQYERDGITPIPANGTTTKGTVVFSAKIQSPQGKRVKMEVMFYDGLLTVDAASEFVNSGSVVTVPISNLPDDAYAWTARVLDEDGEASSFVHFGGNSGMDFNIRRVPVILVPGAMGTRLNRLIDSEEYWPRGSEMLVPGADDYLNEIALDSDGKEQPGKAVFPTEILREELGHVIYGNMVSIFENNFYVSGTTLFTVPYDWRAEVSGEVMRLNAMVQQALQKSPTGKVSIVAHSMGGLLVKRYLSQFENTDFVDKLVIAGSPQIGAPKAFQMMNYGDNLDFALGPIGVLNSDKVKEISQNMPSVYELLPSQRYVSANGGYIRDYRNGDVKILDFNATRAFMLADEDDRRNEYLLDVADGFHSALDMHPINASRVYNIVGCQSPETIGEYHLYNNGKIDIQAVNGDGTVPLVSAMNLSSHYAGTYFVRTDKTDINHLGLVQDMRSLNVIHAIVADKAIELPEGFSTSSEDCFNEASDMDTIETIRISTHSPVALHAYDAEGRHTGPLENGDIELGIPGSSYEQIGETSFCFLPAIGSYRFVADGLSDGSFDMKVRSYQGSELVGAATYLNIPIGSASTNAELSYIPDNPLPPLRLDTEGDGTFEFAYEPTAIITEEAAEDYLPPVITIISPNSSNNLHSAIIPISVSATDKGSGVAYQEIYLDALKISDTNIDAFYLKLGEHTLSVHVADKLGNPADAEVRFRVVATPESTIANVERAYTLGWITDVATRDMFIARIKIAIKTIKQFDKSLGKLLLRDLETKFAHGLIKQAAYTLIKEDVEWLMKQ